MWTVASTPAARRVAASPSAAPVRHGRVVPPVVRAHAQSRGGIYRRAPAWPAGRPARREEDVHESCGVGPQHKVGSGGAALGVALERDAEADDARLDDRGDYLGDARLRPG